MRTRAAAVATAMALAACGGGDETTAERVDRQVLARAAGATAGAGAARVEVRIETQVPGADDPVTIRGGGVAHTGRARASLVLDMSELADVAGAEGEGADGESFRVEEVVDGHSLYLRYPALAQALDASRPWLRIDRRRRVASAAGLDLAQVAQAATDPAAAVDRLRAAVDPVERLGADSVRGASTTRYRASVSLRRHPTLVAPREREDAAAAIERLIELTGVERVPVEAWVDDRGRVRRVRTTVDGKGPAGEPVELETTVELLEFGVAAAAPPPPEREVTDLAELAESGG